MAIFKHSAQAAGSAGARPRRNFLKTGLLGAGLLGLAGAGWWFTQEPASARTSVLRACIPAILNGALASDVSISTAQTEKTLQACEQAISGLSAAAQSELDQLFVLLSSTAGRLLTGLSTTWDQTSIGAATVWLQSMRFHRLKLMQSAYHAIHDIVLGSFYGDESQWQSIGYGGPIAL